MGAVVGELLPLAVGIAISPVPIIAVILMLLSRKATATSTGFLLGWVAGVVVVTLIVLALVGQAGGTRGGEPSTLSSVLRLVAGALLLVLAFRQWQGRPKHGEEGTMPKWMDAVETFTFGKALGLGFVLSGINPKNLLLCVGAGTAIGAAHLPAGQVVGAMVVFTVLASSTVGVPVLGYLAARERMATPLDRLHDWLVQNNAAVMAVLLLVLGTALIGKGIGGF
jgi:threonine/homoserine/homoserine lactone efflux protein